MGPTNLKTFIETQPPYAVGLASQLRHRVGDPRTESEFLWSRSPLSRVDAIRVPVLVAHGARDPRVKVAEAEQLVAAMGKRGIPYEYLVFPDEGHGLVGQENRLRFMRTVEHFLARHLGGRAEP
jgi:dipeptidyl aminopeptidase/acylaminoacyl peptidase